MAGDSKMVEFHDDRVWRGTVVGDWHGHPGWVHVQWTRPERFIGTHLLCDLVLVAAA